MASTLTASVGAREPGVGSRSPPHPRTTSSYTQIAIGLAFIAGSVLIPVGSHRTNGSAVLIAVFAAVTALAFLGTVLRPYGLFSLGGITCAMVAVLFVGRWFFPPVAPGFLTPRALTYYDRNAGLIASSVMIVAFAIAYSITSRRSNTTSPISDKLSTPVTHSASVADLVTAAAFLIVLRLVTGLLFQVGIPGRPPVGIPLVGAIYYATTYGPLAGAALILWFCRDIRSSVLIAGAVLLCDVLVESVLGTHGTAFLAILVFGAAKATLGRPTRVTATRAISIGLLLSLIIPAALVISFVARESLNGGARQSLGDVPTFVATRFGGLEYLAPVVGAVNHTKSNLRNLRTSNWRRYMTAEVYGLPPEARTGFASTAIGWWYGLAGIQGVAVGAGISGLLAGWFDKWCYRRRVSSQFAAALAIGLLLGWATFLLGGTIGSLGGISIGFSGIALAMIQGHRLVSKASSRHQLVALRKYQGAPS